MYSSDVDDVGVLASVKAEVAVRHVSEVRILLADGHRLVLAGLMSLINAEPGLRVVCTVTDSAQLLDRLMRDVFDLVLLDCHLPGLDGIELIRRIRASWPSQKLLVLTLDKDVAIARAAIAAGVGGCVTKGSDAEELLRALRKVAQGARHLDAGLMEAMVFLPQQDSSHPPLTLREQEILHMLAAGMNNRSVASKLRLSEKTVSTHRVRLSKKLGAQSLADLMRHANRRCMADGPVA